jgi:hypothetical protein
MRSGYRPIEAELEQMVIIQGLLTEIIFIIIQHPLNPFYPVVKDGLQFRPLNFTQKFRNANEKILCPEELLPCHYHLHVPEKPEVRRYQVRTVR